MITWTAKTLTGTPYIGQPVWDPSLSLFIMGAFDNDGDAHAFTSSDGLSWTTRNQTGYTGQGVHGNYSAWNPNNNVVAMTVQEYGVTTLTSDGVTFTGYSYNPPMANQTQGGGLYWIPALTGGAAGRWIVNAQSTPTHFYNLDGTLLTNTWTGIAANTGFGRGVATNGTTVVFIGTGGVSYTTDYVTYTGINVSGFSAVFNASGNTLAWSGAFYVCVANNGGTTNNMVAVSPDGINWVTRTIPGFGVGYLIGGTYTTFASATTVNLGGLAGVYSNVGGGTAVGIGTTTPATTLDINGGLTIRNGFRPLYALVTGTSLTGGTTPSITNTNYGTYFNITNSGFNTLTLPTSTYSTDANGHWVLRNNTSSYLSITTTYTGTGGGGSASLVIPPANSTTIMFTSNASGSNAYTFF